MGGIIKWRAQSASMELKSHTTCIAKSETLMPIDMHAQYQHVVKNNFAHQIALATLHIYLLFDCYLSVAKILI